MKAHLNQKEFFRGKNKFCCECGMEFPKTCDYCKNENELKRFIAYCGCCGTELLNSLPLPLPISCKKCGAKLSAFWFGRNNGRKVLDVFCGEPDKIIRQTSEFVKESLNIIFGKNEKNNSLYRSFIHKNDDKGRMCNILDTITDVDNAKLFHETIDKVKNDNKNIKISVFENYIILNNYSCNKIDNNKIWEIIESYLTGVFINLPVLQGTTTENFSLPYRNLIEAEGKPSYIYWAIKNIPEFLLNIEDVTLFENSEIFHLRKFDVQRVTNELLIFTPVIRAVKMEFDLSSKKMNNEKIQNKLNEYEKENEQENAYRESLIYGDGDSLNDEDEFYAMTDGMIGSYDDFNDYGIDDEYMDNYFGR